MAAQAVSIPDVIVGGGGPAGLRAALFTAKNGLDTVVFDDDGTWLHSAHLFNYLGVGSRDGSAFLETARTQVDSIGAERRQDEPVTGVAATDDDFRVTTDDGEYAARYLVLATGADRTLADALGCTFEGDVVDVDVTMETSVGDAYATGAMVRGEAWQAMISAGAAAALNVLSKTKGEHFHDFDTPDDAAAVFDGG
jgi:thioredoxin reductase